MNVVRSLDINQITAGVFTSEAGPQVQPQVQKGYIGNTHRLVPPEETIARVTPLLPVMGITRVANVTGLDTIGIPVVMVCRPNSRSVSVSQGKGFNLAAAKASGIMESIESYHAERISLPMKLGCYEDVRYVNPIIDVAKLPRFSDSKFTPYTRMLWVEGRDLMNGDMPLLIPYELVHLDYTLPLPMGHGCFVASSNGLASGNHLLEAISHGICEVVERDATTLWHLLDAETQAQTRIDLDTVDNANCSTILDLYEQAGVSVAVWETTSDVGIPAFLCRILQNGSSVANTYRPASGMGCHPSRDVALLRALTEAAQSRLTFISGSRDDMRREDYEHFLDPATHKNWHRHMEHRGPARDFNSVPTWQGRSFDDDIRWALERLRMVGIQQVGVVDLSKPEFGIAVVRVVIPGLEGVDGSARFLPGQRAKALLEEAA